MLSRRHYNLCTKFMYKELIISVILVQSVVQLEGLDDPSWEKAICVPSHASSEHRRSCAPMPCP